MTLRELAEKKSEPPRPRLKLSVGAALPPASATPRRSLPSSPDETPGPENRLLGTENRTDILPMFPPRGPGPEREWEQACLLPAGSLGMILDATSRTAWLACSRPGMPPLLLYPLPVLGRLSETPLEPLDESPLPTSHGAEHSDASGNQSRAATAQSAG